MREDVPYIDNVPSVLVHRDQPVLVSPDIEHRENAHCVGVGKVGTDIG
jgi:hypothetical protein